MKIPLRFTCRVESGASCRGKGRHENAFAVLVVIILLAIMASLAISNNVALGHLHREIQLLERRHQKRHESGKATNAPPAATTASTPERSAGLSDSSERPPKQ
jgi:hypothetical protein